MISDIMGKVLAGDTINDAEYNAVVDWFASLDNAPQELSDLFKTSTHIAELSDITPSIGSVTSGVLSSFQDGGISIDLDKKAISINSPVFGASGIQLQYNSGSPQVYFGNGSTQFLQYTGGNVSISGAITATSGTFSGDVQSANYSAGVSGFILHGANGNAEFNNIIARGSIQTAVFQKNVISSIGGQMLVLPADVLDADMTSADSQSVTIKGNETFAVGDILRMKDATNDEWFTVTSIASAPTYSVTRDAAGSYAANSNPAWKKGQAVVNYGASGNGGLLLKSGSNPELDLFNHTGSPWTSVTNEVVLSKSGISAAAGGITLNSVGMKINNPGSIINFYDYAYIGVEDFVNTSIVTRTGNFAGTNLLTNGDFETGNLTGWTSAFGSPSVQSTTVHGGSYAVKLVAATIDKIRQNVTNAKIVTFWQNGGSVSVTNGTGAFTFPPVSSWTFRIVRFTTTGAVNLDFTASSTTVYLDDIKAINSGGTELLQDTTNLLLSAPFISMRNGLTNEGGEMFRADWSTNAITLGKDTSTATTISGPVTVNQTLNAASALQLGGVPITYGTYTPTATDQANVAAGTVFSTCQWMRVGNVVTVSGDCALTTSGAAAGTTLRVGFDLPVASTFTGNGDCAGAANAVAASTATASGAGRIGANTARTATIAYLTAIGIANSTAYAYFFSFTYIVK